MLLSLHYYISLSLAKNIVYFRCWKNVTNSMGRGAIYTATRNILAVVWNTNVQRYRIIFRFQEYIKHWIKNVHFLEIIYGVNFPPPNTIRNFFPIDIFLKFTYTKHYQSSPSLFLFILLFMQLIDKNKTWCGQPAIPLLKRNLPQYYQG